jgi:pilus assembly protein CpaB
MGRWRAIIPVLLAVIIAVVGGLLTYRWAKKNLTPAPSEQAKAGAESALIAVAAADLPWGTQLDSTKLRMAPYLKQSLPPGSFQDVTSLEGRVVVTPLKENEPVLESKLAPASVTTGGVSAVLKPGKRALAVKGDKVIGLSGFVKPGDRVDVLVTLRDPTSETQKEVTKIVLQDIPVLATGTELQQNAKGETYPVDVYTLEVTPEEGEKLGLAASEGKLQFALRNAMDTETVLTNGATIPKTLASYTKGASAPPKTQAPVKRAARPSAVSVTLINGSAVSQVTFPE